MQPHLRLSSLRGTLVPNIPHPLSGKSCIPRRRHSLDPRLTLGLALFPVSSQPFLAALANFGPRMLSARAPGHAAVFRERGPIILLRLRDFAEMELRKGGWFRVGGSISDSLAIPARPNSSFRS